jgi:hypothetical protein
VTSGITRKNERIYILSVPGWCDDMQPVSSSKNFTEEYSSLKSPKISFVFVVIIRNNNNKNKGIP